MAVRGTFGSGDDEYHYKIDQLRLQGSDHFYTRGISWDKVNSADLDFIRVQVTRPSDGFEQFVTM